MNYLTPDKETINLEQTKEYVSSFDNPSKHSIWRQKYSILEWTHEVKKQMNGDVEGSDGAAAPGAKPAT